MQNLPSKEEGAKAEADAKRVERIAALNIVDSIYYVTSNYTKVGTKLSINFLRTRYDRADPNGPT
jgi:hypothetical protein